jgi:hypothetical protein
MREDRSILDAVTQEVRTLHGAVGPGDRRRLDEYLDAVREIERRIQKTEEQSAVLQAELPERPIGIPVTFEEHCNMMYDLQALAYQADITRVVTFLLGRELTNRTYADIGVPEPHHETSHHEDNAVKLANLARIDTYHVQLFARYLEKLRASADGDGSLLDHTTILYGGGLSDSNAHSHRSLPLLVAGGGVKGGRHLTHPKGTPMANLLVSLVNRMGVPMETIGDSTGAVDL